jgi:hypothetical protein
MSYSHRNILAAIILLGLVFGSSARAEVPPFDYETAIPGYYLGHGVGMTVDADGNAFLIASWYQDHQHLDFLVVKLDDKGTVLWTIPIVGDQLKHDYPTDITLDLAGDVWITGWTDSESFPIVNGLDDSLTGFRDAFVMKLDSEDGTILYSTLLGGDYADHGRGIVLNEAGEIYIVGSTGSTDFPTTEDAYQGEPSAPLYIYEDAFITKISAAGDEILYSTYFGGFKDDSAKNIALDVDGNIVFSGETNADDFPLVDPIQSGPADLFVSKLSADGSTLLFSTYLGGEDYDRLSGMDMDPAGFVYLTGSTRSINFPTTAGAFQEEFVGEILGCDVPFGQDYNCEDGFVTKLGTDGTGLVYSTFLGGTRVDEGRDLVLDDAGCAHIVGYTASPDFPGSDGTSARIFLSKLNQDGSDLAFTLTTRSGSANAGHGIAIDDANDVYFTGAINVPADIYVAKVACGIPVADVPDGAGGVSALRLDPSVPNPFRHSTHLTFAVPGNGSAPVFLGIHDVSGRLVRVLVNTVQHDGPRTVSWDGTDEAGERVPGGVYFYELRWNGERRAGRTLLLR